MKMFRKSAIGDVLIHYHVFVAMGRSAAIK